MAYSIYLSFGTENVEAPIIQDPVLTVPATGILWKTATVGSKRQASAALRLCSRTCCLSLVCNKDGLTQLCQSLLWCSHNINEAAASKASLHTYLTLIYTDQIQIALQILMLATYSNILTTLLSTIVSFFWNQISKIQFYSRASTTLSYTHTYTRIITQDVKSAHGRMRSQNIWPQTSSKKKKHIHT